MAEHLGLELGEWLYHKEVIQKEQVGDIRYAFEIICSEFLQILIIVLHGIITGKWNITIVYLLLVYIIRNNFQGYHAKTIWKCFFLTIASYGFTISCYSAIHIDLGFIILIMMLPISIQIRYCRMAKQWKPMLVSACLHSMGFIMLELQNPIYLQVLLIVNMLVSVALLPKRKEEK